MCLHVFDKDSMIDPNKWIVVQVRRQLFGPPSIDNLQLKTDHKISFFSRLFFVLFVKIFTQLVGVDLALQYLISFQLFICYCIGPWFVTKTALIEVFQ